MPTADDRLAAILERALVDLRLPKEPRRRSPTKADRGPLKGILTAAVVISLDDVMQVLNNHTKRFDRIEHNIEALRTDFRSHDHLAVPGREGLRLGETPSSVTGRASATAPEAPLPDLPKHFLDPSGPA